MHSLAGIAHLTDQEEGDSGVAAIVTGGAIFGFAIFALFFYLAVKAMQWRPTLVTPAVAQAIRDAVKAPKNP